ncbi:zinc finger protein 628-like [Ornithodoros turicata]|uniref:zinc finger protein 628-like n=1 Tax=Ornithodoros turicata TaxID=34597 RepID=UPI003138E803
MPSFVVSKGKRKYLCKVCPYTTFKRDKILRHERTHTGERPFKCSYCDYVASRPSHLKNHERTHTGIMGSPRSPRHEADLRAMVESLAATVAGLVERIPLLPVAEYNIAADLSEEEGDDSEPASPSLAD